MCALPLFFSFHTLPPKTIYTATLAGEHKKKDRSLQFKIRLRHTHFLYDIHTMPIINGDTGTQYEESSRLNEALAAMRDENSRLRRQIYSSPTSSGGGNPSFFRSEKHKNSQNHRDLQKRNNSLVEENRALKDKLYHEMETVLQLRQENASFVRLADLDKCNFEELQREYRIMDKTLQQVQDEHDSLLERMQVWGCYSENGSPVVPEENGSPVVPAEENSTKEKSESRDRQDLKRIDDLLQAIKPLRECPICLDYLKGTHSTPECLHRFCEGCIKASLRKCKHECPSCRARIPTKRYLRPDKKYDDVVSVVRLFVKM